MPDENPLFEKKIQGATPPPARFGMLDSPSTNLIKTYTQGLPQNLAYEKF